MVSNVKSIDLSREFLLPFGQPVAARFPKRTWRFDVKSEIGIYAGISHGSIGGGLVYYPSTKAIDSRADLVPLEITPKEFKRYENTRIDDKRPSAIDISFDIPEVLQDMEIDENQEGPLHVPGGNEIIPLEHIKNIPTDTELVKTPTSRRKIKELLKKLGVNTRAMSKLSMLLVEHKRTNFPNKKKRKNQDDLSVALNADDRQSLSIAQPSQRH